ncbi:hypothetical protein A6M27_10775 [Acidithiobacillus thiooxidans]|uniref:Uncharacterized protein n=1 Tax=Acidithiobacillus thiooxidans TaxID=930 RepID=A0A1C2ILH0_ACITH|nr:hypothetical protein [Acidithiobacillus thiooxidans]OCX68709.1 hypothetical protein A6O24_19470 [Acidithiobacillus thiooxidans]OCX71825.1 hypothetical protein A6P07_11190 [Acidithiobacillus thiooxidans]OCX76815.1 hypothetical protein A6O26_20750 [Acidithiobacillus thiooxidans]OCX87159.1 hypothetical protein A6M27_10775 [Acidithiobacillus thiooxidans]OFC49616.1 hypothetical protein BAE47_04645 [Acidithiobacillus thiooxidans]
MESLDDINIFEYLSTKYPNETLKGHRQQLYAAASDIAQKVVNYGVITKLDALIMRDAWECSRTGHQNIMCAALSDAIGFEYPYFEHVESIINSDGFLTKKELWHTARMRKKEINVFRGCSTKELENDELGYSWTLDREVAHFFADAHCGKVITAKVSGLSHFAVWLDTAESELIITEIDKSDILSVENANHKINNMKWFERKHLTPLQQIKKKKD